MKDEEILRKDRSISRALNTLYIYSEAWFERGYEKKRYLQNLWNISVEKVAETLRKSG